jgi:very-short-patch-repair endonuclease
VQVHFADLDPGDLADGIATGRVLTLQQCLRSLPFDEALAVADSALRAGDRAALRQAAALARGRGCAQVRRVAALARAEAANPFESCLRAIALEVPGLAVEPQVLITSVDPWCRPDLVDEELRIVLEADSFAWHGDRAALAADARRYNVLVADGWLVLRFAWEHVMSQAAHVRTVLERVVRIRRRVAV